MVSLAVMSPWYFWRGLDFLLILARFGSDRMPLTVPNQRIVNPTTGISYRLMAGSETWRITRSTPAGNVVALIHLKGTEGAGSVADDVIAQFVAGRGVGAAIVAPSGAAFRSLVLADFIWTSERLLAAATRARDVFHGGLPGMRPRSPVMRQRFEMAYAALHDAWTGMAATWGDSFGRENVKGLPDWMVAAWGYRGEKWDRSAALEVLLGP